MIRLIALLAVAADMHEQNVPEFKDRSDALRERVKSFPGALAKIEAYQATQTDAQFVSDLIAAIDQELTDLEEAHWA